MPDERRSHLRAECDLAVSVSGASARAFDVSEAGVGLRLPAPVEPGAACRLTLRLPHGAALRDVPATVAWCQPDPRGGPLPHQAGLAFGDLDPAQRTALDSFVRRQTLRTVRRMRDAALGLRRVSRFLDHVTDLRALLEATMKEARELADAEASSLLLWDADREELFFEVALGEKADGVRSVRLKLGQGVAGAAAQTRAAVNVPDVNQDDRWFSEADAASGFRTRSILAVPMLREDRLVGVLEVLNHRSGGGFTGDDEANLSVLAGQAALVIENARLHDEKMQAERMAVIGRTVSELAHCIKNILNGIQGGAYIIEAGFDKNDADKLRAGWDMVKRNNAFLSGLVLDMLAYAKEREPAYEDTDVNELLGTVADLLAGRAKPKGITVRAEPDEGLGPVCIDRTGIYRVLLNLGGNAVDACTENTGEVVLRRRSADSDRFVLQVQDNGAGISPEHLGRLFTDFFSTKGSKGTGLGLVVSHKIVTEHGGTIDVASEPGQGTTFTIHLPLRPEGAAKANGSAGG